MNRASAARWFGSSAAAAWLIAALAWRGWGFGFAVLGIGGAAGLAALGEWLFDRWAGAAQKRADLEERTRNPPS